MTLSSGAAATGHAEPVASATWSIPALADEVGDLRETAVRFARAEGVPSSRLDDLRLAISEAVTNAVVHAFRDTDLAGTVTLTISVIAREHVDVVVDDDGMGMEPRDDSPGLGLGLALIGARADAVEHRRPPGGAGFELWMRFLIAGR